MQNHLRRKCNQSICSAAEPVSPRRTKGASRREAAVTTAPQQGIVPNSHGHTSPKERTSLFPATLQERARARRFSQRSRRPPPIVPLTSAGRGGSVSRRDHSPTARNRAQLAWAYKSEGTHKPIPSHSSRESTSKALLAEKPPSPTSFPSNWQGAAALSAAVTTAPQQGIAPNSHGHTSPKEHASLFPATLRERGSGGEALLLEKRPLPQRLPPRLSSEGGPGEGLLFREAASPGVPLPVSLRPRIRRGSALGRDFGWGRRRRIARGPRQ